MAQDQYDPEQQKVIVDPAIAKEAEKVDAMARYGDLKALAKQCDAEWRLSWDHQYSRKTENLLRLKLYNNQRRDKDLAGDTTMFSVHQTLLASLYIDQLTSQFSGREEGDDEQAENLTRALKFDYEGMMKDVIDYDWIWDTLFFAWGIVDMTEFKRDATNKIFLPVPETLDPTTFLRDPRAVSPNGNNASGKNSARFWGRPIRMSRAAMKDNPNFFDRTDWKEVKYGSGTDSLIEMAESARADAQGYSYDKRRGEEKLGGNAEYDLIEWNTHWEIDGSLKKVRVWLANQRKLVMGCRVEGDWKDTWKIVYRPMYPTAHTWDGVSVPDITEDKQRARAVAQNLGMKALTSDLYPDYVYDTNKITNRNDLKPGFNKMIPSNGDPNTAIAPKRKAAPNLGLYEFIYQSLQLSAEKATATPDVQQGVQSAKDRPLGETNAILNKVDTRYSLSARIFGWSERDFDYCWYFSYKENFPKIDEKIIRIAGAFGDKWRPLTHDNLITKIDPDVTVESSVISRAKQLEERNSLTTYFTLVFADPTANRRYGYRKLGKLYGLPKDEMDRLLPATIDERQAEDENDLLNKDKPVQVFAEQDHNVHLEMHAKANPTNATLNHIETHKKALSVKKVNPAAFPAPEQQADTSYTPPGSAPAVQPMGNGAGGPMKTPASAGMATPPMQ